MPFGCREGVEVTAVAVAMGGVVVIVVVMGGVVVIVVSTGRETEPHRVSLLSRRTSVEHWNDKRFFFL